MFDFLFIFLYLKSCFALGLIVLPDSSRMQVVLLVIGSSLVGGVSNLWTVLLGGNLNLSLILSVINTVIANGNGEIFEKFALI